MIFYSEKEIQQAKLFNNMLDMGISLFHLPADYVSELVRSFTNMSKVWSAKSGADFYKFLKEEEANTKEFNIGVTKLIQKQNKKYGIK